MIGMLICLAILFGVPIAVYFKKDSWGDRHRLDLAIISFLLMTLIILFVFYPIFGFTGGLCSNYSSGFREGFLTKQSQKGLFYKTYEYEIQVGVGQQAALQAPFAFSVSDKDIVNQLAQLNGKRVKVYYNGWLIQPFSQGDSGYNVYKVEEISSQLKEAEIE